MTEVRESYDFETLFKKFVHTDTLIIFCGTWSWGSEEGEAGANELEIEAKDRRKERVP